MITNAGLSLPWLEPAWSQLQHYIIQDRIPQALLLSGQKGLGKQQLAQHFAHSLLCSSASTSEDFCGKCQSCLLFQAETHPDYILIEPVEPGKAIAISAIRQLITKLELKPQFEGHRVVVINPADSLNNAAANAFLKYLEEPTERTSLVLIASKLSKLPATIISRCQKLNLVVPDEGGLTEWLKQEGVKENHALIIKLSQGAPFLAKQFASKGLLALRNECFNNWDKIAHLQINPVETAEQWKQLEKTETALLLFWLISWVTDMIKLSYQQQPGKLFNPDLLTNLQDLAQKLNLKELYKYYDFLLSSLQNLDTQLNKQLMFEEILIHWSRLNNR